jgi:AraC family transcriptional regulator
MEQPPLDHHYVTLHLGGAKRITRRGEGPTVQANTELGDLSIMPAGSTFSWRTEGPIGFAHLYLTPRTLDQVIIEEFDRDPRNISLVDRVGFNDPLLKPLLCSMFNEIRAPGVASRLLLDALLRAFILKLVRDHSTVKARLIPSRDELAPYRLRHVLAFIEAHLAEDISLSDLAALSGNSLYHFSRGFRRATGLPPYRYLVERRIERAKILLQQPFLPLAEVARQCGFNSQRQFGTMFTRFAGISPGRFQRER